jgi:uncharacterized protein
VAKLDRRGFLKAAPAAGVAAYAAAAGAQAPRDGRAKAGPAGARISSAGYTPVVDYPIQPKRHSEVTLTDRFWKPKVATNADVTIPAAIRGRGLNGNILEAAILSLQTHPNPHLEAQVEARVQELFGSESRGNSGFEVAATRYRAMGKRDLLDKAIRTAETLYEDFRLRNPPFSGGERDAMNCVQLYRSTHDRKHLDLAKHYLDIRGLENSVNRSRHNQSYMPVLEQREAVGHAVNGVTLMVSLVDVGVLTGIKDYFTAGQRMWADAVSRKMYITGGVGSTGNEGFGEAYSLPNISAYSETCAVLMFITLSHRLFLATGDSQYIDVMERGMYNNALCGVSASGNRFFYVNRLASAGDGRDERWERASLECCPPNLVRFLASMPGFVFAQDAKTQAIYVNLYVSSAATFSSGGKEIALTVDSEMPWQGRSRITVSTKGDVRGAVKLRIPGWGRNQLAPGGLYRYASRLDRQAAISVNGTSISAAPDKFGYVTLDRIWTNGDIVTIDLPVEVRKVLADDRVVDDRRRMAVERGPIVYCAEWPDVEGGRALDLLVDPAVTLEASVDKGRLGDVVVIDAKARRLTNPQAQPSAVRLVPYFLWANRGAGEMTVWLSTAGYVNGDIGPGGGFIFYENPNYAADGWRYLEAAPFDQSAGAGWGCFRTAIAGARGTAVGDGQAEHARHARGVP